MTETILANAQIVLPDAIRTGAIRIEDGLITDISAGASVPNGAQDLGGDILMPGLVELHTDNLERHIEPRSGVHWPLAPAILAHDAELASVGITTVFDALRIGSVLSDPIEGLRRYARPLADALGQMRADGALRISHLLHLRCEITGETLLDEIAEFSVADQVRLISLMDHTPGQRQFRDYDKMKEYICGKRGLPESQFEAHIAGRIARRETIGDRHQEAVVAFASALGATLASHDDTTAEQVAQSRANGALLAEFPTTLEAAQASHDAGLAVIMGAPNLLRGLSHSGNIAAETLAEAGYLDILSSDYVPASLLGATFRLGEIWGNLPRAICCATANPARATGLHDRGEIRLNARADLLQVHVSRYGPILRHLWVGGRPAL